MLAIPRLHAAASEEPVLADAFIGVPVRQRLIEPVSRVEHVVLRKAVDNTARVIVVIEVDDVVGDQVHRTVECAQRLVVERLHAVTAGAISAIVDVLDEQPGDPVEILTVDCQRVPLSQVMNLVARE